MVLCARQTNLSQSYSHFHMPSHSACKSCLGPSAPGPGGGANTYPTLFHLLSPGRATGTSQHNRTAPTFGEEYGDGDEGDVLLSKSGAASSSALTAGSAASQAARAKTQEGLGLSGRAVDPQAASSTIGQPYCCLLIASHMYSLSKVASDQWFCVTYFCRDSKQMLCS